MKITDIKPKPHGLGWLIEWDTGSVTSWSANGLASHEYAKNTIAALCERDSKSQSKIDTAKTIVRGLLKLLDGRAWTASEERKLLAEARAFLEEPEPERNDS